MGNTTNGDVGVKFNADTGSVETGIGRVNRGLDSVKNKAQQVERAVNKNGGALGFDPRVMGKATEGLSKVAKTLTGMEGLFFGAGLGGLVATGAIALFNGIIGTYKQKMEEAKKIFEDQQKTLMETGGKARSVPGINNKRFNSLIAMGSKMGTPITGDDIGEYGGKLLKLNKKATDEELVSGIYAQRNLQPSGPGGDKLVAALQALGLPAGRAFDLNELSGNRTEDLAKHLRKLKKLPESERLNGAGDLARQLGLGSTRIDSVNLDTGAAALIQQKKDNLLDPVAALNRIKADNEVYKKNYPVERGHAFSSAASDTLQQMMKDPRLVGMSKEMRVATLSADVATSLAKSPRWAEFFKDGTPGGGVHAEFATSTGSRLVKELTKAMYANTQSQNNAGVNLGK